MNAKQFDARTRGLSSRRTALTAGFGGLATLFGLAGPTPAGAHDPSAACRKLPDPGQRRKCLARAKRHKRKQHTCRPQPVAVTCANRCGAARNNCRKAVSCTCPTGKVCLENGSCNRICSVGGTLVPCPVGCECGLAGLDGQAHCIPNTIEECEQVPMVCTSTAQCPLGHFCSTPVCNGQSRCIPVCPF